jgi:type 1 glutamine amidotransferase
MKHRIVLGLAVLGLLLAARPAGTAPPEPKLRVLLTYGGHDFQEKDFFALWDSLPGIVYTRAPLPQSADRLKPGLEAEFDAIVCYDMVKELSPEQQRGLLALLDRGIGLVSLHHNLGSNLDWPDYHRVIGGTWLYRKATIDGREYGPSTYEHGQEIAVKVADPDHPITRGLRDFVIHDETYGHTYVDPSVHVLLSADNPKNVAPFLWTRTQGNSRVVYFQAGHDAEAWRNPSFPEILVRSIRWAARKSP